VVLLLLISSETVQPFRGKYPVVVESPLSRLWIIGTSPTFLPQALEKSESQVDIAETAGPTRFPGANSGPWYFVGSFHTLEANVINHVRVDLKVLLLEKWIYSQVNCYNQHVFYSRSAGIQALAVPNGKKVGLISGVALLTNGWAQLSSMHMMTMAKGKLDRCCTKTSGCISGTSSHWSKISFGVGRRYDMINWIVDPPCSSPCWWGCLH